MRPPAPEIDDEVDREIDIESTLDAAKQAVIEDLPAFKQRQKRTHLWRNRPEHLRKSIQSMSEEERREYYLWKAGEISSSPQAFSEQEMAGLGAFLLPLLNNRMPNPQPISDMEYSGFVKSCTPLVNKYFTNIKYKEEMNALLFGMFFILPRCVKHERNHTHRGKDTNGKDNVGVTSGSTQDVYQGTRVEHIP